MATACCMDRNKIKEWGEHIKARMINRPDFVEIWEDKSEVSVSTQLNIGQWFNAENL